MHIQDLLFELGRQMGLGPLSFPKERVFNLKFDGKYVVYIELAANEKTVYIYSILGVLSKIVPARDRAIFMEALLCANLSLGKKKVGVHFGYDSDADEVFLFRAFPADDINYQYFVDFLDKYLKYLEESIYRIGHGDYLLGVESHSKSHSDANSVHSDHSEHWGGFLKV